MAVVALAAALPSVGHAQQAAPGFTEIGAGFQTRALLAPRQETTLASQFAGRIAQMAVKDGDRFRQGDVLVAFDCAMQRAQLRKAQAELDGARHAAATNRQLSELRAGSALNTELAQANAAKAAAEVESMQVAVGQCEIKAPFSGRVVQRKVNPYQSVGAGVPLLEILDDSQLEVRLVASSRWLAWLGDHEPFGVRVDETGRDYPARISRLGARIDPASQTLTLIGEIDGQHPELLAGMSGTATFNPSGRPSGQPTPPPPGRTPP